MPENNDSKTDNQASQQQAGQQQVAEGQAPDTDRLQPTLNQLLAAILNQLQNPPSPPIDPAAKAAVEKYNEIVAGLQLRPSVSAILEATDVKEKSVQLKWTTDAISVWDGFDIMRCLGQNCQVFTKVASCGPSDSGYLDTGVYGGQTYRYQVIALSSSRGDSPSNTVEVSTPTTRRS